MRINSKNRFYLACVNYFIQAIEDIPRMQNYINIPVHRYINK